MAPLYFEDVTAGDRYDCGSQRLTADDIIEIGERFDPQPYHIDREVAEAQFGDLLASAIHTLGICQRLVTDEFFSRVVTDAGAGFEEVQCQAPVLADDKISVSAEILGKRPLDSHPDRGLVRVKYIARNQFGDLVMTAIALPFFKRRDAWTSVPR